MKSRLNNKIFIQTLWMLLFLVSCTRQHDHSATDQYICPMHPTVVQDRPGTCPVCGMDLVKRGNSADQIKITRELNYLLKPTNAVVTSSVNTIVPVRQTRVVESPVQGIITWDSRQLVSVPVRFGGRIEKLFLKYNFQPVRKGQKILELYSPELVNAQQDLLFLLKHDAGNGDLLSSAKQKLRLLGVSEIQIEKLISAGQVSYSFDVFSPVDGYIVEGSIVNVLPAQNSTTQGMGTGMGSSSSSAIAPAMPRTELQTREGMYVRAGEGLFNVIRTAQVWAEFDVHQKDGSGVKEGEKMKIRLEGSEEPFEAVVNFVQPFLKGDEPFVKIRSYLPNPDGRYKIGQLVTAVLATISPETTWIPLSASLDLGTKRVVFIKRRGVFRPRTVVSGRSSGEWLEVLRGLDLTDSLAYNAQFMIDSESFIKVSN